VALVLVYERGRAVDQKVALSWSLLLSYPLIADALFVVNIYFLHPG
jgi:hypothetical protein